MTTENVRANWNYPTAIKAGAGRLSELPQYCQQLSIRNPLLVTDPGLANTDMVARAQTLVKEAKMSVQVFSHIKGNPNGQNVSDGVRAYKNGHHDGVIAFGGGSALDAAKAIALMAGQSRPLWDFEDIGDNYLRVNVAGMAPTIAIPTTAGTGSEVGRASIITDDSVHVKKIIFHPKMLPSIVILDPELSVGLPAKLTAATGMDALSHSMEAYCATYYHPLAVGVALEGMRLVKDNLETAVGNGHDLNARMNMLSASSMGATAFQRGLGAMHALAHPLGAVYDAHHGMLNAILMPYVLRANETAIADKMTALARYLNLPNPSFMAVLDWVLSLRERIGIPHNLSALGIPEHDCEKIGAMAVNDPSAGGNPIAFTADEYADLCRRAVVGLL